MCSRYSWDLYGLKKQENIDDLGEFIKNNNSKEK